MAAPQQQEDLFREGRVELGARAYKLGQITTLRGVERMYGAPRNTIKGNMAKVSLDEQPEYEALSYVWGGTTDMVPLRVHQDTIYITKNLALALRHLRRMASPRVLWIDALCINQIDIVERNHQVAQMRYIYENAVEVLVWLGEEQIHTITGLKTRTFDRTVPLG